MMMMFAKKYIRVFDTRRDIEDLLWENVASVYPAQKNLAVNFTEDMKRLQDIFGVVDIELTNEVREHVAQCLAYHPRWPLNWNMNNSKIHLELREIIAFTQVDNGMYYLRFNFNNSISDEDWAVIKRLTITALSHFIVGPNMEISYGVE